MRVIMGDVLTTGAMMPPASSLQSLASTSVSSWSSLADEKESLSSNDGDSSFSSCSSSSSFSGSEATLDISIQSEDSPAAPTQLFNILVGDSDDSSCSSASSTSSSMSSGSKHTMPRNTKSDSWVAAAARLVPCHFVALSDLVHIPCAQGSTPGILQHGKNQQPPQQQVPETVQIDSLLLSQNPELDKINDKVKEPAAKNTETRGRVPIAEYYKMKNGVVVASTQGRRLNPAPTRVSSSAKKSQQTSTLLDVLGLQSGSEDAEVVPTIPGSRKRQVSAPSISYNNNKMSLVGVSNGVAAVINAPPIPAVDGRSRRSRQVISARAPRSRGPPPIGYGMFTLVEEQQPQTLKGEVLPIKTDKASQAQIFNSDSAGGCSLSATLSPARAGLSSSTNKSVRWSDATGSHRLSPSDAAPPFSDSEAQPPLVIESDSVYLNPKKTEPEPVTLSELAMNSCMANDALASWTGDTHGVSPDGQQAAMAGAPVAAKEAVDVTPIPSNSASKAPSEVASVTKVVAKAPKMTTPTTTTTTTTSIANALPVTRTRTPANSRGAKRMVNSSTGKATQKAPVATNTTVPKTTTSKKHTTSKVLSLTTKTRIPASQTLQKATPEDRVIPPTTDQVSTAEAVFVMPIWTPAKPLSAPLIPAVTPIKKIAPHKLQSRWPTFPVAQE